MRRLPLWLLAALLPCASARAAPDYGSSTPMQCISSAALDHVAILVRASPRTAPPMPVTEPAAMVRRAYQLCVHEHLRPIRRT